VLCGGMAAKLALIGFMVVLAALDFAGTVLAKEWTIHRAPWQLVAGAGSFVALFVVLALGLCYAEMSIIILGWIVVLQTGVILIDRSRYGTSITTGGWVAIALILVLQGYLVLGATESANAATAPAVATTDQSSAASAAS
jgi:hypothetical protein